MHPFHKCSATRLAPKICKRLFLARLFFRGQHQYQTNNEPPCQTDVSQNFQPLWTIFHVIVRIYYGKPAHHFAHIFNFVNKIFLLFQLVHFLFYRDMLEADFP